MRTYNRDRPVREETKNPNKNTLPCGKPFWAFDSAKNTRGPKGFVVRKSECTKSVSVTVKSIADRRVKIAKTKGDTTRQLPVERLNAISSMETSRTCVVGLTTKSDFIVLGAFDLPDEKTFQ